MITKEDLVSDIVLQLTQSAPSKDLELEEEQVAFWIQYHLNDLIKKEILAEQAKGKKIPPIYIVREIDLELTEEEVEDISDINQRMYVELENEVLDLPNDDGVVKVLDYDLNSLGKTTTEDLEDTKHFRFAKPSTENPLFYREGKLIFIIGLNTADIEFNPFMVHYVKKQDVLTMTDTDEILITDQLIPILIDLCVQRGKLELYGTQADAENDGKDTKQPMYHLGIQNPTKQQSPEPEE